MAGLRVQVSGALQDGQPRGGFPKCMKPSPDGTLSTRDQARLIANSDKNPSKIWAELTNWASKQPDQVLAMKAAVFQFLDKQGARPGSAEVLPDVLRVASHIAPLIPAEARRGMLDMANKVSAMNGLGQVSQSFHSAARPDVAMPSLPVETFRMPEQHKPPEQAFHQVLSDLTSFITVREIASRVNDYVDRGMTFLERATLMPERTDSPASAAPRQESPAQRARVYAGPLRTAAPAAQLPRKAEHVLAPRSMPPPTALPSIHSKPASGQRVSVSRDFWRMPSHFHAQAAKPAVSLPATGKKETSIASIRAAPARMPGAHGKPRRKARPAEVKRLPARASPGSKVKLPRWKRPSILHAKQPAASASMQNREKAKTGGKKPEPEKRKPADAGKREARKREDRKRKDKQAVLALLLKKAPRRGRRIILGRPGRPAPSAAGKHNR